MIEPQPLSAERSVTCRALAKQHGVSFGVVYAAVSSGQLPHFKIGNLIRVRPSEIPADLLASWKRRPKKGEGVWPEGDLIYFLQSVPGFVKIGFTTDLATRVRALQPGCPLPLTLLAFVPNGTLKAERAYHRKYAADRLSGEWFTMTPRIRDEIARLATHPTARSAQ